MEHEQEKDSEEEVKEMEIIAQDNTILYIIFGIIMFILFIWLLIIFYGKSEPIKILGAMNNRAYHIPASTDS